MLTTRSLGDCRSAMLRLSAAIALGASLLFGTLMPAQAVELPHNLPGLTSFYLKCLALAITDPAEHDKVCGTPGPAAPGANDNDTAGPGSNSCVCPARFELPSDQPAIIYARAYACCYISYLQAAPDIGLDFGSLQEALDAAPAVVPAVRGMDTPVLPAI